MYTELFGSTLRLGTTLLDTNDKELPVDGPSAEGDVTSCMVARRTEVPSGCGYSGMICFAGNVMSLTSMPRRMGISTAMSGNAAC